MAVPSLDQSSAQPQVMVLPPIEEPLHSAGSEDPWKGSEIWLLAKRATFDSSPIVTRWLETVAKHMPAKKSKEIPQLVRAIVGASKTFGIRYELPAPVLEGRDSADPKYNDRPADFLKNRGGHCSESTMLVAATLQHFGVRPVLISGPWHVIAAAVSPHPIPGVTLAVQTRHNDGQEAIMHVYPIEADFGDKNPYDVAKTIENGRNFMLNERSIVIWDLQGRPFNPVQALRSSSDMLYEDWEAFFRVNRRLRNLEQ